MAFKSLPREERQFDKTFLSEKGSGKTVGRDYGAHYFRWGHAFRFCSKKRVLDVGCGPEYPLGRVLCEHGRPPLRPAIYVGVDLNPLKTKDSQVLQLRGGFDFSSRHTELVRDYDGPFDVVSSFEVYEHAGEEDQKKLLAGMKACLAPEGTLLISTPVRHRSGHQARNHIREVTIPEMREALETAGFKVVQRYGTYGDVPTLMAAASPDERAVAKRLAEYYSSEVISNFLAPLYPDQSKNNLWRCVHA